MLNGLKYERKQKLVVHKDAYATLSGNKSETPSNDDNKAEEKS